MALLYSSKAHVASILVIAALSVAPATAADYATVTSSVSPASVKPGGTAKLTIKIALKSPKFHINSNKPADAYSFPTSFAPTPVAGMTAGAIGYPKPAKVTESYSPTALLVYQGTPTIVVPIKISKSAKPGTISVGGTLKFQGCDDKACYPPQTKNISVPLAVK